MERLGTSRGLLNPIRSRKRLSGTLRQPLSLSRVFAMEWPSLVDVRALGLDRRRYQHIAGQFDPEPDVAGLDSLDHNLVDDLGLRRESLGTAAKVTVLPSALNSEGPSAETYSSSAGMMHLTTMLSSSAVPWLVIVVRISRGGADLDRIRIVHHLQQNRGDAPHFGAGRRLGFRTICCGHRVILDRTGAARPRSSHPRTWTPRGPGSRGSM